MNEVAPTKSERWRPWKPLGFALAISLFLHLLGSFAFNARGVMQSPPPPTPPLITFLSPTADAPSIQQFRQSLTLADPSASSLPNLQGFSATTIERSVLIPSLIESQRDDPLLLARPQIDLTQLTILPEVPVTALLAARAMKQPAESLDDEGFERIIVRSKAESSFLFSGPVKDRKLLTLASIPLVRAPAPAQPTVVRIAVSSMGDVKFAVIEKSSGADDKDARALDIIRRWRFQALSEDGKDQWGSVAVYWAAEPPAPPAPADTNAPGAKSQG